uniref:CSD domain-containing protein n=1 Tax=Chromera velia CCMP2878 TaxID=1169474 RepID=A0A0G4HJ76_9ALVE|eukprot:Cvel_1090.t1-p1 / transcript=Cvel_1090.t1 / gene=Cvel_1090 / organism=Chromera_velia_CCMP2878 / gene_product=hypothetical protein / transcript_product=hypothetical protein / location=Cvel_scaffold35:98147-104492(+) / protein_length=1173 / sequence_SO=supercontig / SO=protein_coding / is_pseudo=false
MPRFSASSRTSERLELRRDALRKPPRTLECSLGLQDTGMFVILKDGTVQTETAAGTCVKSVPSWTAPETAISCEDPETFDEDSFDRAAAAERLIKKELCVLEGLCSVTGDRRVDFVFASGLEEFALLSHPSGKKDLRVRLVKRGGVRFVVSDEKERTTGAKVKINSGKVFQQACTQEAFSTTQSPDGSHIQRVYAAFECKIQSSASSSALDFGGVWERGMGARGGGGRDPGAQHHRVAACAWVRAVEADASSEEAMRRRFLLKCTFQRGGPSDEAMDANCAYELGVRCLVNGYSRAGVGFKDKQGTVLPDRVAVRTQTELLQSANVWTRRNPSDPENNSAVSEAVNSLGIILDWMARVVDAQPEGTVLLIDFESVKKMTAEGRPFFENFLNCSKAPEDELSALLRAKVGFPSQTPEGNPGPSAAHFSQASTTKSLAPSAAAPASSKSSIEPVAGSTEGRGDALEREEGKVTEGKSEGKDFESDSGSSDGFSFLSMMDSESGEDDLDMEEENDHRVGGGSVEEEGDCDADGRADSQRQGGDGWVAVSGRKRRKGKGRNGQGDGGGNRPSERQGGRSELLQRLGLGGGPTGGGEEKSSAAHKSRGGGRGDRGQEKEKERFLSRWLEGEVQAVYAQPEKQFGFIRPTVDIHSSSVGAFNSAKERRGPGAEGQDVHFHFSSVIGNGGLDLAKGDFVVFKIDPNRKPKGGGKHRSESAVAVRVRQFSCDPRDRGRLEEVRRVLRQLASGNSSSSPGESVSGDWRSHTSVSTEGMGRRGGVSSNRETPIRAAAESEALWILVFDFLSQVRIQKERRYGQQSKAISVHQTESDRVSEELFDEVLWVFGALVQSDEEKLRLAGGETFEGGVGLSACQTAVEETAFLRVIEREALMRESPVQVLLQKRIKKEISKEREGCLATRLLLSLATTAPHRAVGLLPIVKGGVEGRGGGGLRDSAIESASASFRGRLLLTRLLEVFALSAASKGFLDYRTLPRVPSAVEVAGASALKSYLTDFRRQRGRGQNRELDSLHLPGLSSSGPGGSGESLLTETGGLPQLRVKEKYESAHEFLDAMVRLLRFECFAALFKGISDLRNGTLDLRDMAVHDARLVALRFESAGEGGTALMPRSQARWNSAPALQLVLKVDPRRPVRDWKRSRNLMFGNLIAIARVFRGSGGIRV